ncbi:MAG TPA: DMT family transporter [Actinomycetota bacterium]|nr:DMT family transporter [Actinomycetota bacterium]
MLYGFVAALGWGLTDFFGAVVGRRIGSLATVLLSQAFSALFVSVVLLGGEHDVSAAAPYLGWIVLNGAVSATAYSSHYRALELGPVAVVSPIGAAYAVVGVALSMIVLGERPSGLALLGGAVTIAGVMLTSTDLRALKAGTHGVPPGLPWALVAAVTFGIGGFLLAYLSKELGWVTGLWSSRVAQLVGFVTLAAFAGRDVPRRIVAAPAIAIAAIGVGLCDLIGVVAYSIGNETEFASILFVSSAVFPLLAVTLSVVFLHERPVPNQYAGVAMTVGGLVLLGFG